MPLSETHRAAISASLSGKPKSAEARAKQSAAMTGRKASAETREKLSRVRRGQPKSDEHKAAISAALTGKLKSVDPSYHAVHGRMGKASEHICACGNRAYDWSYQFTAVDEKVSPEGWPYSEDPSDYLPMCRSCHKKFEAEMRNR